MRRFEDREQYLWDVIVGRESWGAHYALFVPTGDAGRDARQAILRAGSYEDAMGELDQLDDAGLQKLLDVSTIKEG